MNNKEFKAKLQKLQNQLEDAERLRKEFDELRSSIAGGAVAHVESTKGVIDAYLEQAQSQYAADMEQIKGDRAICEQVRGQDRLILEKFLHERSQGFPTLSKVAADYLALRDEQLAGYLETKSHPALNAAIAVRQIKDDKRTLDERCRILQYQLLYYEELFPALADYREIDNIDEITETPADQDDDPVKDWLTKEEYTRLPRVQRFQLALDHYWTKRKTSWRLGRDYERYIGYLYEEDGYSVHYKGIIDGLDDCGRDLICRRDGAVVIVQCKYWSQKKVIHEKHINQLFGTCVEFWIDEKNVRPAQIELFPDLMKTHQIVACITTSTKLSDRAKQFASTLGVQVHEDVHLKPYPCIKCNVSQATGERIYHLPFDQQYDRTTVDKGRNECYVQTVVEAEALGFRRAFRWQGET